MQKTYPNAGMAVPPISSKSLYNGGQLNHCMQTPIYWQYLNCGRHHHQIFSDPKDRQARRRTEILLHYGSPVTDFQKALNNLDTDRAHSLIEKAQQNNPTIQLMSEEVQQHIKDRFQFLKKIGSGAYGHVWKVRDKQTNQTVALKKIFDAFQHATDAQRTFRQISYLKQFKHSNIIEMKRILKSNNEKDVYVIFEYMDVDLHRVIREDILKEKHKKFIIYQIAKALKYLHTAELIHRDLKPSNILLNEECGIKICDFGLVRSAAAPADKDELVMTEYVATRWYRAPQILLGWTKYSKSVDIWSFGCLIAEMFKNKPLFPGSSTLDQLEKVISWTGYPTPKEMKAIKGHHSEGLIQATKAPKDKPSMKQDWFVDLDPRLKDLITKMLHFDPSKRPTIEKVLQHPYLEAFHDSVNEPRCQHPILIQTDDSIKLSVKAYRQKIWMFCDRKRAQSPLQAAKMSQDLGYFARSHIKRRSIRNAVRESTSQSIAKTLYMRKKRVASFKSSMISAPIAAKPTRTPSRQLTQTQTASRHITTSCDQQKFRYRNESTNIDKDKSLNNSNNISNCQAFQTKKRSVSTVKNRRSVYNCNEYRKSLKAK